MMRSDAPIRRCLKGWHAVLTALPETMVSEVTQAYSDLTRHYHDSLHVGGIWSTWLRLGGDPGDKAILWAAAYHDLVYEIGQPGGWNEEQSAIRLHDAVTFRHNALDLAEAESMIRATKDHLAADLPRERLFCDLDLAGLACPWDEFADNSQRIRLEYAEIPDDRFYAGRRAFWASMLSAPRIFRSDFVPAWWEGQARDNISRDIERLGAGR